METVVLKFGGSSVSDNINLNIVAKKIIEFKEKEENVICVVSAQGKTTDNLIKEAKELSAIPNEREMDSLLSTGEQISASKLAILLNRMGYKAKTVNSVFIDNVTKANEIKAILSKYISNTSPYVNLLIRGNPDIQLGSILTISSEVDKVNVEIMVTKQELSFNDSLECRLTGIDTSMLKEDL